jgi:hypothetical protein
VLNELGEHHRPARLQLHQGSIGIACSDRGSGSIEARTQRRCRRR